MDMREDEIRKCSDEESSLLHSGVCSYAARREEIEQTTAKAEVDQT